MYTYIHLSEMFSTCRYDNGWEGWKLYMLCCIYFCQYSCIYLSRFARMWFLFFHLCFPSIICVYFSLKRRSRERKDKKNKSEMKREGDCGRREKERVVGRRWTNLIFMIQNRLSHILRHNKVLIYSCGPQTSMKNCDTLDSKIRSHLSYSRDQSVVRPSSHKSKTDITAVYNRLFHTEKRKTFSF